MKTASINAHFPVFCYCFSAHNFRSVPFSPVLSPRLFFFCCLSLPNIHSGQIFMSVSDTLPSVWAALHITTQTFSLIAANYNIPLSSCLWPISVKQTVIVMVIVMWERHLCAGMLLRWKPSVWLCQFMSASSADQIQKKT